MLLAVDINRIYLEYIQMYSQVQQCQNVCLFPGNLAVASDPKASLIGPERHKTKCSFTIGW